MAALRGTLTGNGSTVSRLGSKNSGIDSTLNTWEGKISTFLSADGEFIVTVVSNSKGQAKKQFTGNVNTAQVKLTT